MNVNSDKEPKLSVRRSLQYPDQIEDGQSEKLNLQKFTPQGDVTGPSESFSKNEKKIDQNKSWVHKVKDAANKFTGAILGEGKASESAASQSSKSFPSQKKEESKTSQVKRKIEETAQEPPGIQNLQKSGRQQQQNIPTQKKRAFSSSTVIPTPYMGISQFRINEPRIFLTRNFQILSRRRELANR